MVNQNKKNQYIIHFFDFDIAKDCILSDSRYRLRSDWKLGLKEQYVEFVVCLNQIWRQMVGYLLNISPDIL